MCVFIRAAPIAKFPPIPILGYSQIQIPIQQIADTDTFGYNFLKNL